MQLKPRLWGVYDEAKGVRKPVGQVFVHVDDFFFTGDVTKKKWNWTLSEVRKLYTWGEWEESDITQYGVHIHQITVDGKRAFFLEQEEAIKRTKPIAIENRRQRRGDEALTDRGKSQVAGICGEAQWYGVNSIPTVLSKVAEIQARISQGAVDLLRDTNQLVNLCKEMAGDGFKIF